MAWFLGLRNERLWSTDRIKLLSQHPRLGRIDSERPDYHELLIPFGDSGYVARYRLDGKTMVITHTGVPEPVAGRGIANLLTRKAVEVAADNGWKVHPACSYAVRWFERNTEYKNLLV